MKKFLSNLSEVLADAALLEMGVPVVSPALPAGEIAESLEENLVEAAFAEAAAFDEIHEAILRKHRTDRDIARPDDCQYGDNDLWFV